MNNTDFRTMSDKRLQLELERLLAASRLAAAKRSQKYGMRRRMDGPSDLDAWRGPAWGYVAYAAMLIGSLFMLTSWGKALLLIVWGVK